MLSGGPLSYQYTLKEIVLHYGREEDRGSEHTISGHQFPAEIQLYAFNSQLYANWSAAQTEANGLLAIAILISHTQQSIGGNAQLKHITHALKNISGKGINTHVFIALYALQSTLYAFISSFAQFCESFFFKSRFIQLIVTFFLVYVCYVVKSVLLYSICNAI